MNGEYRPVADFDGYVINAKACVWSVGRTIQTKGGATRTTAAKPLKPDEKGRVTLRRDGQSHRRSILTLAAEAFGLPAAPDPQIVKTVATARLQLWRQLDHDEPDEVIAFFEQMVRTGRIPAPPPEPSAQSYVAHCWRLILDHFSTTRQG